MTRSNRSEFLPLCAVIVVASALVILCLWHRSDAYRGKSVEKVTVPSLSVLIWQDYISPEIVSEFEKKYSCRIDFVTFNSNDELLDILQKRRVSVDVFVPSSYILERLNSLRLIDPIRETDVPSKTFIDESFVHRAGLVRFRSLGVPYLIAPTIIAYRKNDNVIQSPRWRDFGHSRGERPNSLLNEVREGMAAGLFASGTLDPNSTDQKAIELAAETIEGWIANRAVRLGGGSENAQRLLGEATGFVQAYGGDVGQLEDASREIVWGSPNDGYTITCDYLCVSRRAQNRTLAMAFLDFMCRPEISARNMTWTLYRAPNSTAFGLVANVSDVIGAPGFIGSIENIDDRFFLKALPDEITKLYEMHWARIQARYASMEPH